jgi:hypothetical protein
MFALRYLCTVLLLLGAPLHAMVAQQRVTKEVALSFLAPIHGVSSFSPVMRDRIASDSAIIRLYADILEGREPEPDYWYPSVALWWLAESRDPQYVPLFVRFTESESASEEFSAAAYGLAQHANLAVAAQRLRELAATASRAQKVEIAVALMYVNSNATRAILQLMDPLQLPEWAVERRSNVLLAPALPDGVGRGPCLRGQQFERGDSGAYRCQTK